MNLVGGERAAIRKPAALRLQTSCASRGSGCVPWPTSDTRGVPGVFKPVGTGSKRLDEASEVRPIRLFLKNSVLIDPGLLDWGNGSPSPLKENRKNAQLVLEQGAKWSCQVPFPLAILRRRTSSTLPGGIRPWQVFAHQRAAGTAAPVGRRAAD